MVVADAIRPFWLPGLITVSGPQLGGIRTWITKGTYNFDFPVTDSAFSASVSQTAEILEALASDINRFSIAAFESAAYVNRNKNFPRAAAWLVINAYYSAFFATHSILRFLGISCVHLDASLTHFINAFGSSTGMLTQPAKRGFYTFRFDASSSRVSCTRSNPSAGGVHESFWQIAFTELSQL